MGDTAPMYLSNLVKEGITLVSMLCVCCLDDISEDTYSYILGIIEVTPVELLDDITDQIIITMS